MTTVLEALNGALREALKQSKQVHFIGEDILDPYGGAFKVAQGLSTDFPERVVTTPVSEAGIVGVGIGMAMRGLRPVVEIMFGDFVTLAADQLINHAAKLHWIGGDQAAIPLVVRTPMGGRRGYGPTHSQSLEKHFLGAPGLRVVAVSALDDPGALLHRAILDDDAPVLFIEHKLLYTSRIHTLDEMDEFEVHRKGNGYPCYHLTLAGAPAPVLTFAAYGYMAELVMQAVYRLAYEYEVFTELIVPTQLSPFELELVIEKVSRSRRLVAVEEGSYTLGWGAEVLSRVTEAIEKGFSARRVAARDLPLPAAGPLEAAVLPGVEDIMRVAREMAHG
jgi:pyruvate/2-oxoglutarate/acetoin dehydrogenase E1 component